MLFDRSEFAHSAPLRLSPALTESCDKLQNQTFKDRCPRKLPGNKKLNLSADFGLASHDARHCRDKIEFNLKSLKLEEPLLFRATPLALRDVHFRHQLLPVNENFEVSSFFFAACILALRLLQSLPEAGRGK